MSATLQHQADVDAKKPADAKADPTGKGKMKGKGKGGDGEADGAGGGTKPAQANGKSNGKSDDAGDTQQDSGGGGGAADDQQKKVNDNEIVDATPANAGWLTKWDDRTQTMVLQPDNVASAIKDWTTKSSKGKDAHIRAIKLGSLAKVGDGDDTMYQYDIVFTVEIDGEGQHPETYTFYYDPKKHRNEQTGRDTYKILSVDDRNEAAFGWTVTATVEYTAVSPKAVRRLDSNNAPFTPKVGLHKQLQLPVIDPVKWDAISAKPASDAADDN